MSDCPNAEMRDRLPDLLHERLEVGVRAVMLAHVEQCPDCRGELRLLREAHVVLLADLRGIDLTSVTRAVIERTRLPVVAAPRRARSLPRRPWSDWRIAASVALLVIGGGSFIALRGARQTSEQIGLPVTAAVSTPSVGASTSVATRASDAPAPTRAAAAASAELSVAGGVSDLSEGDLRALLRDLDELDAEPLAEPEPVGVRVALPATGSSE